MDAPKGEPGQGKISHNFWARLSRLEPRQSVRAVVLLHTQTPIRGTGGQRSPGERRKAVDAARRSAEQALIDVDVILQRHGGRRLAPHPDALGTVPVETTAAGITALAGSRHVKAILEDQPVSLIRESPDDYSPD